MRAAGVHGGGPGRPHPAAAAVGGLARRGLPPRLLPRPWAGPTGHELCQGHSQAAGRWVLGQAAAGRPPAGMQAGRQFALWPAWPTVPMSKRWRARAPHLHGAAHGVPAPGGVCLGGVAQCQGGVVHCVPVPDGGAGHLGLWLSGIRSVSDGGPGVHSFEKPGTPPGALSDALPQPQPHAQGAALLGPAPCLLAQHSTAQEPCTLLPHALPHRSSCTWPIVAAFPWPPGHLGLLLRRRRHVWPAAKSAWLARSGRGQWTSAREGSKSGGRAQAVQESWE